MRKIINFLLFIVFIIGAFSVYSYVNRLVSETSINPAAPLIALVKQITVQATPVILPDRVTIVREVNALARLETASFTGEKIVTSERNQDFLWGILGETLIFIAVGEVIAGVDLAQMAPEDIQVVDPTTVMVHLPEAEVFVATLDNDLSYVADRDTGLLTTADAQLETQVRQEGEKAILEAALEYGIMEQADTNAKTYMENFLKGLGFETVIFTEETPPTPAVPYVQPIPKGYTILTPTP